MYLGSSAANYLSRYLQRCYSIVLRILYSFHFRAELPWSGLLKGAEGTCALARPGGGSSCSEAGPAVVLKIGWPRRTCMVPTGARQDSDHTTPTARRSNPVRLGVIVHHSRLRLGLSLAPAQRGVVAMASGVCARLALGLQPDLAKTYSASLSR